MYVRYVNAVRGIRFGSGCSIHLYEALQTRSIHSTNCIMTDSKEGSRPMSNTQIKKLIYLEKQRGQRQGGGIGNSSYSSRYRYQDESELDEDDTKIRQNRNARSHRSNRTSRNHVKRRDPRLSEPVYGVYEGDHIFGVQSVYLALLANRRNIKELLIQDGIDTATKKVSVF